MKRAILVVFALIVLAAIVPDSAQAQFYKGKTITMIVNYPAGGPTDLEGRIVALHLPAHIPGNPTIVVKNVGGAGGLIGSNQLGEAAPNGESIGFFTLDVPGQLIGNSALKTRYSDFVLIAGVESPLVVYIRKDTPPGINVAADLMKTQEFKALSLNAQNTNTLNQALALDLLGVKIPRHTGLSRSERGRDGDPAEHRATGQLVALGLERLGRADDGTRRHAAVAAVAAQERPLPAQQGAAQPADVRGILCGGSSRQAARRQFQLRALRAVSDPQLAMFRVAMMPPKSSGEAVATMRTAFAEMWKSPQFLADYSKVIKTEPILVTGAEGQEVLSGLATVSSEIKEFLVKYTNNMTSK